MMILMKLLILQSLLWRRSPETGDSKILTSGRCNTLPRQTPRWDHLSQRLISNVVFYRLWRTTTWCTPCLCTWLRPRVLGTCQCTPATAGSGHAPPPTTVRSRSWPHSTPAPGSWAGSPALDTTSLNTSNFSSFLSDCLPGYLW